MGEEKIIDFGKSKRVDDNRWWSSNHLFLATAEYMSLESMIEEHLETHDMWAVGYLVLQIWSTMKIDTLDMLHYYLGLCLRSPLLCLVMHNRFLACFARVSAKRRTIAQQLDHEFLMA